MYILDTASAKKKMAVNELRNFTFENYYKQFGFYNENSYYSMRHQKIRRSTIVCKKIGEKIIEKLSDSSNTKEYYNSYLKRK